MINLPVVIIHKTSMHIFLLNITNIGLNAKLFFDLKNWIFGICLEYCATKKYNPIILSRMN